MTFNSKSHNRVSLRQAGVLLFACLLTSSNLCTADETQFEFDGHTKTRLVAQTFPDDSIFHDLTGSTAFDVEADLRLNLDVDNGPWTFNADRRLLDLTSVITDDNKFAALHRLDRLWLGYANDKTVLRIGRQAISWGNGLFFSPMDIVNPFDPTQIDTEYKAGDDMLYAQFLRDSGDDVQAAAVFRRNPMNGDVESDEGTSPPSIMAMRRSESAVTGISAARS
jgi:hypothetical protein